MSSSTHHFCVHSHRIMVSFLSYYLRSKMILTGFLSLYRVRQVDVCSQKPPLSLILICKFLETVLCCPRRPSSFSPGLFGWAWCSRWRWLLLRSSRWVRRSAGLWCSRWWVRVRYLFIVFYCFERANKCFGRRNNLG